MTVHVTSGVGSGPTELAAFDAALIGAGVANFNLITLSSVIPPSTDIVVSDGPVVPVGEWGDRLYVVLAQERVTVRNAEAWAGLGWMQDARTGRGLFVEHHGNSEAEVERDISDSLETLRANRGESFGPQQMKLAGVTCEDAAVCALVVAAFGSAGWAGSP